jgi:hypothetical protein
MVMIPSTGRLAIFAQLSSKTERKIRSREEEESFWVFVKQFQIYDTSGEIRRATIVFGVETTKDFDD